VSEGFLLGCWERREWRVLARATADSMAVEPPKAALGVTCCGEQG